MSASNGGQSASPAVGDFIHLNEELASLVRARMPLESNLRSIGAQLPAERGKMAARIGERLSRGESFADAFTAECETMPAIYRVAMISGLRSGNPGGAIESIVDTATRLDQVRRVTGVALLYPLIVVCVFCVLFGLVITRVTPQFEWLNRPHFGPFATLSRYPHVVEIAAVAVPCLAILAVVTWWSRSGRLSGMQRSNMRIVEWLPGLRRVRYWSEAATFAELMLLLVKSNVPLNQAFRLMSEATDDRRLKHAAMEVANRVERGEAAWTSGTNDVRRRHNEFPLLIRLALYHAENRPLLVVGLKQAAALYRERAVRAAEWYAEYLPVLLTVGIGGTLTMCFTLAVLWPYASALHEMASHGWR